VVIGEASRTVAPLVGGLPDRRVNFTFTGNVLMIDAALCRCLRRYLFVGLLVTIVVAADAVA